MDAAERIINEYIVHGPRQDDPPVDPLPFLRLEEVLSIASELARRRLEEAGNLRPDERVAPLTPGAFYKAFSNENQERGRGGAIVSFRRYVTRRMINRQRDSFAEPYIQLGRQLHEQGFTWSETVRVGVEEDFNRWSETPALILLSALALHARDPDITELTYNRDDQDLTELAQIYETLLPVYRRRMRHGLTVEQMATVVSDLICGMAINSRFSANKRRDKIHCNFDGTGDKNWHLSACAALAIYERFTEPVDDTATST